MSSQNVTSQTYNWFTPKKLVTLKVGKTHLRVYPKNMIGKDWLDVKINPSINVNTTTLLKSWVSNTLVVDTQADQFGVTAQVQIHFQKFISLTKIQIHNPSKLDMVSYHMTNGNEESDAMTTDMLGTIALRPYELWFPKIRCDFNLRQSYIKRWRLLQLQYIILSHLLKEQLSAILT